MKTQQVQIKKFKCLEDFNAEINGQNVLLLADNGRGKSSFMQFIKIALGDNNCIPPDAEGSGTVIMSKDGKPLTFSVKMKEGKAIIRVEGEGVYIDDRKGAISALVGAMDFNIDKFVELSKTKAGQKKQVEIFKSFLPQDVRLELSKLEERVRMSYDERTEVNREKDRLSKLIQAHPLSFMDAVDLALLQPCDIKVINQELSEARKANEKRSEVENRRNERLKQIAYEEGEIEDLMRKIQERRDRIKEFSEANKKAMQWLEENKSINTSLLEKQMEDAGEVNAKYTSAKNLISLQGEFEIQVNLSGELTAKIDSSRQAISDAVKDMDSPVEGLAFNDEMLLYNGVPVSPDSLSTSEIIELGVRLKVAENPDLGILFIEHGESLGKERLQTILDVAKNNNFQVIIEQVERGKDNLTIEFIEA